MTKETVVDASEELLREMLTLQRKQTRRMGIVVGIAAAGLALMIIFAAVLLPTLMGVLDHLSVSLEELDGVAVNANELISNANAMLEENSETVTEAVRKLNDIDFDKLNEAIVNLNDAVRPLSNLSRLFG